LGKAPYRRGRRRAVKWWKHEEESMRLGILLLPAVLTLSACMTAPKHDEGELASPEELGVEDPDPEEETVDQPAFCNPTGKKGEDLRKCYEHNETLYKDFDEEAKKREPWFNFTPDSWAQSPEVDAKHVFPVVHEAEAIKRLEAVPLVELTAQEVQRFTGKAPLGGALKPYLVRGLVYFRQTGAFAVFQKNGNILVRHDSIGGSTPPESRSAVVVYLDFKPKEVYVDCGVAE
jgi:hypothetical protein